MPKTIQAAKLTATTSGTDFAASSGETRYVLDITASAEVIVDVRDSTSIIESFRVLSGLYVLQTPIAVLQSAKYLRFRVSSGSATVIITYISQT